MIKVIVEKEQVARLRQISKKNWPGAFFFARSYKDTTMELHFAADTLEEEKQFENLINR